ncbi:hypothetical protein NP493_75g09038 [Ridgeia piscesae]|uniref:Uncharacterized protein n=1 Tax=Ridgeia piscesae TaxID=27915 RepID=A0AAD9P9A5_RIDPI|nr:hypothetical protein NP493_75g09038 [Ridgeia piscesae]
MERKKWRGQFDFIMSALSYVIGLGNLWRFPIMCYRNGGGTFLICFLVITLVAGFPLLYLECCLGQYGSVSVVSVWKVVPLFQGIGWTMLVCSWSLAIYYNMLIAYAVFYIATVVTEEEPWKTCGHWWNTASGITQMGNLRTEMALCLFCCWVLIFICLCKGIDSSGKAAYITATVPYAIMVAIFTRVIPLEGSADGVLYLITPKWELMVQPKVWCDAAVQVFYSMSICSGGIITLASYNRLGNNCLRDAIIIAVADCLTSILCGVVIFAILGHMANNMKVSIDAVLSRGAGLVYVVYPAAIADLSMATTWVVIFMSLIITLGIGTMVRTQ